MTDIKPNSEFNNDANDKYLILVRASLLLRKINR
jgi:hypothetical protein